MFLVLLVSALIGLYISTYFTLVYYRKVKPDTRYIPTFCRLDENTCQLVIRRRNARVFWVPNFVLGMVYYLLILLLLLMPDVAFLQSTLLYTSWLTVALAIYLIHSLVFVVKIICPLCMAAHAVNIIIAIILTFWWWEMA